MMQKAETENRINVEKHVAVNQRSCFNNLLLSCDKARVMVFETHVYTWVYSKEDTMAHTRRLVVIS